MFFFLVENYNYRIFDFNCNLICNNNILQVVSEIVFQHLNFEQCNISR